MFIPLALIMASVISGCFSYSNAKRSIADDLNEAIVALVKENGELWTRQDTIAALRKMHETTDKPVIYQASDVNFKNSALRDDAYFTLALVDKGNAAPKIQGNKIASDSIMLVPEKAVDGLVVQVQAFADCSMSSVFAASDQTLPGVLLVLSMISMAGVFVWRRMIAGRPEGVVEDVSKPSLDGIRLTPMQRRFVKLLIDAPGRKADKSILCAALWGNKSNAEESLYTLVRRTKAAIANANVEIVCNRGESYELRIKV